LQKAFKLGDFRQRGEIRHGRRYKRLVKNRKAPFRENLRRALANPASISQRSDIMLISAHRAHDYKFLIRRWRAVAKEAGLKLRPYAETSGHRLYYLDTQPRRAEQLIYLSAGIHGDEPAGTEALILWAESNPRQLAELPCLIFPCLNPWGLINNRRVDEAGQDLNRLFHRDDLDFIRAWKAVIGTQRFKLAMTLHEDYDAQGVYLYEIQREKPWWGEDILRAASRYIGPDPRKKIEGRAARDGVIRRNLDPKLFEEIGFPEAAYLHLHHACRTFTIETPSEYALDDRVGAQLAVLNLCLSRVR
jgi:hypothetical protein